MIARLVRANEDSVRQVIHRFNEMGMPSLHTQGAGGRPRQISADDEHFIVATANTRPATLDRPFTYAVEYPQARRGAVRRGW
ncbi:hypothetical protein [Micromonospora pisi]|uniref:hypothetical protein n=1 Tax=Micromonospora pisi TaxID=589240 RepID=UPI003CCC519F